MKMLSNFYIDEIIKTALKEDINYIDVTTDVLELHEKGHAKLVAKSDGVIAGIDITGRVFELCGSLGKDVEFNKLFGDGDAVKSGDVIATLKGCTATMLKAERTALNILQHMSGIATYTHACVAQIAGVAGSKAVVCDTRKTLPGLRGLQKYAVLCGGGTNHRFNLSSAVMLKDNHIDAYGGITKAVEAVFKRVGHMVQVEVEVRDLSQLKEALKAGADVIMLDNMSTAQMREAVAVTNGQAKLEASGNVTLLNIREIAETGVDIISVGALTHSVNALDISLIWN